MPTITTSDGVGLHYTDNGCGAPVVLLAGFTTPATSWALQERALLDDCGHAANFDQPDAVNPVLLDFLGKL